MGLSKYKLKYNLEKELTLCVIPDNLLLITSLLFLVVVMVTRVTWLRHYIIQI